MYCPNCGQQQMSEEMRFCSRCGLALTGLAEWLAGGTRLDRTTDATQNSALSPRRRGMRRAAKLMFFSGVLFPVCLLMSLIINHGELMAFPFVIFFVSLVLMLYTRLFTDKTAPVSHSSVQTSALGSASTRGTLPNAGRPRVRTNELAQPPSVTENTTRLLDNE